MHEYWFLGVHGIILLGAHAILFQNTPLIDIPEAIKGFLCLQNLRGKKNSTIRTTKTTMIRYQSMFTSSS
jgi:hypothetical protein